MRKIKLKYKDFAGEEREEEFYFHFTRSEILETEIAGLDDMEGMGYREALQAIATSNQPRLIMHVFKDLILKAYGVRTLDGRHFNKSPEIAHQFSRSAAYDELFVKLVTDAAFAAEFFNGVIPSDLGDLVIGSDNKRVLDVPLPGDAVHRGGPGNVFENSTSAATASMTLEQLQAAMEQKLAEQKAGETNS